MSEYLLETHELHKVYRNGEAELHVLKGIDLTIEKGRIISIVGPSGAGKSTLLHLLGGLDVPTSGEVILKGMDLYKLDDEKRAKVRNEMLGFVFQFYHLLPEFTALENVVLPVLIKGMPKKGASDYAKKLLQDVGLGERLNHKPSELSGGEHQRVAIARALVNEPEIVFCDEPTGNLDSKTGSEIQELLWRINREKGETLIIVTHDEKIARQADRIIHIEDGVLRGA
ncbi:MAG: ABC transporter ATP-binding protein [Candidatus Omnitrophica bacterium]|nr:ABC transporter ATP-binding protein [Candidatus Omnitrophota bacterium]